MGKLVDENLNPPSKQHKYADYYFVEAQYG